MRSVPRAAVRAAVRITLAVAAAASPRILPGQQLVASVNDAFAPCAACTNGGYVVDAIGWYFTPTTSITVNAVHTIFAAGIGGERNVTVGIYSDAPAVGGSLLAGGSFNSATARGAFGGATFAPVTLVGGTQYLIGYTGMQGLVNFTLEPGSVQLPARFGPGFVEGPGLFASSSRVILQFFGPTTTVPEPGTWALVGTGLVMLGGIAARRGRRST